MGWLLLGVIGVAAFLALRLIGVPRAYDWLAGAALMLGATGYALQGRPALAGHPVKADAEAVEIDPGMVAFRTLILPGTGDDREVLATADAQLRSGDTGAAVRVFLDAIGRKPRDSALWTGLGGALAAHDGGQLSPAARFAFRRAWQLSPREPGPPFFLGLALAQSGDFPAAKTAWLRALALTPVNAPYRVDIAERLVLLDQLQAMAAAQGRR